MASAPDPVSCNCRSGKTVTSFCKKHLQPLCMECLLSKHRECISDIITIEEVSNNTHPLWNDLLTQCETYKLLFEKQKSQRDEIYRKMDAADKEFRVTISKMRLEMIKRINRVCKNALELSVSVLSQRVSVAKSDVEKLDNSLDKLQSLKSLTEKRCKQKMTENEFITSLDQARKELDVIETSFKDLKDKKNEVFIQFVVPSIVTDFMEHFNSLGEIVEEVKEDGRTSVYKSDEDRRDIPSRIHVESSPNPFKLLRSTVDEPVIAPTDHDTKEDLFIFHKGKYNQEDGDLYAYIDVQKPLIETADIQTQLMIPPLPLKPNPCSHMSAIGYETPDYFVNPEHSSQNRSVSLGDAPRDDVVVRPKPKPRPSIGKGTKSPEIIINSSFNDDQEPEQQRKSDEIHHFRPILRVNSTRQSTSSDRSNGSSRTAKTDSGIILQTDDKYRSCNSSPANGSPSGMPLQIRNEMYRFFPGPELRGSDPALNAKGTKWNHPPPLPINLSKSMGRIRFSSGDKRATTGNNTYPKYPVTSQDINLDGTGAHSKIDSADVIEELDRVIDQQREEEEKMASGGSAVIPDRVFNTKMPTTAMSMIELQSHKKDTKDVCIITSIVVTKNQFLIVCDYSHNCLQVYDRLGNRIQVYGLAKPFGSCLMSENTIAVTSRNRSSINMFDVNEGMLKFVKEHRLGNLVSVFGLAFSNGYICVCCLTNLMLFTEDLRPYSSVKAISGLEPKGTLRRKKSAKPVFSGVKYCAIDFNDTEKEIYVSDFKQDRLVRINAEGDVKWVHSVKAPKSIALNQGKLYAAAKKQIVIIDAGKGLVLREVHEGVPKYPWSLFIDDITSTMFITNGSINDTESRKIQSLPLKILTMILG